MASGAKILVRRFIWEDLEAVTHIFNEINGIANSEKAYDLQFMKQFLAQPSCNPEENCFLAECDGSIAGFVLIAPEPPISRSVASGGVLKIYRNQGIGRMLLKTAIDHSKQLQLAVLHVETMVDGAAARHILESEGFNEVKSYWQMRWEGDQAPSAELPDGLWLRTFVLNQDEATLTELQNLAFGENWGFSPNTLEEIHARVRLDRCDPEGIIFIIDGDRPAGYNWTLISSNGTASTGFISMTGVHPDYRGRGMGRAVVAAGMEYLHAKGVDGIELEVDSVNPPARELYLKLGFKKIGQTIWYEKRLTE